MPVPMLPDELAEKLKFIAEHTTRFNRPQSFPFYPDDWLGSSRILSNPTAVEGAYIHLLAVEWGSDDLWLPDDDEQLSIASRLNSTWHQYSDVVRSFFCKHPLREGLVSHKLVEIRYDQLSYQLRGQAGGLAKGLAKGLAEGKLEGKQTAKLEATSHSHSHSLSQSQFPTKERSGPQPSADGLALANTAYDLISKNHPNLPTFKKDKARVLESWSKIVEKFMKRTGKQTEELERFFKWLAQDRQEKRPGNDWVGWWQPFQSVVVLEKDSAWAAFGKPTQGGYVPRSQR